MRVLLIGLGSIGRKHIHAIRQLYPDCQFQAWRSGFKSDEAPIEGIRNIHSIHEAAEPDFIIISNPTAFHREVIEQVLVFKRPLFIEKPIFHKIEKEEEALIDTLETEKHKTYVACNLRFHPAIIFLREMLQADKQKVDEVTVYCGSYLPDWRKGTDFRSGYSANPEMGGGVHLDLIHEMDYVYYIFGEPLTVQSIKMNKSSLGIESIDSARYIMGFSQFSLSMSLNYFRREAKRTIEIIRAKDILLVDLLAASITDCVTNTILFKANNYSMVDTYRDQMNYFINNKSGRLMNDAREAFKVLKLVLS